MLLLKKIREFVVVPVLNIDTEDNACFVAEILLEEGLGVMELTFRNNRAAVVIAAVRQRFPEILLGAGTLRNEEQFADSLKAGADFLVSPSIVPQVISAWHKCDEGNGNGAIDYVPGVSSPREVEEALEWNLNFLKFFPAEASGGVAMLKALGATHPEVSFMPTGGISENNAAQYLRLDNVVACGASSIVPKTAITERNPSAIRESVRRYRDIINSL